MIHILEELRDLEHRIITHLFEGTRAMPVNTDGLKASADKIIAAGKAALAREEALKASTDSADSQAAIDAVTAQLNAGADELDPPAPIADEPVADPSAEQPVS